VAFAPHFKEGACAGVKDVARLIVLDKAKAKLVLIEAGQLLQVVGIQTDPDDTSWIEHFGYISVRAAMAGR
jgi:hypothetical protein